MQRAGMTHGHPRLPTIVSAKCAVNRDGPKRARMPLGLGLMYATRAALLVHFTTAAAATVTGRRVTPVWALLSDEYTSTHELFAPPAMSLGRGRSRHACQTKEHVDAALDQIGMLAGMAPVAQQRAAAIKASLSRASHSSRKLECNTWGALAPVAEVVASTVRPSVSTASCAAANADMKRYIARRAHEQRQRKIAVRRAASHARPPAPIAPNDRCCDLVVRGEHAVVGAVYWRCSWQGASSTGTCSGRRTGSLYPIRNAMVAARLRNLCHWMILKHITMTMTTATIISTMTMTTLMKVSKTATTAMRG